MIRRLYLIRAWIGCWAIAVFAAGATFGQTPRSAEAGALAPEKGDPDQVIVREIFVPAETISRLLENAPEHVFLSRDEYHELLKKASAQREAPAPLPVTLCDAQYEIDVQESRATIFGALVVDVLQSGWHALPVGFRGVGLRRAQWDDTGAVFARDEQGQPMVIVNGEGTHVLRIEATASVLTGAAQQTLDIQLPTAASTRVLVRAPGNVELRSGAHVVARRYDPASDLTQFDLLAPEGEWKLVFSVNNRILQRDRLVVARSAIVDQLLRGREVVRMTSRCTVLRGAVDRLTWLIPADLELHEVNCEQLARWELGATEGATRRLTIFLRSTSTEAVTVRLLGERPLIEGQPWQFPRILAQDVAGSGYVLGVLIEWPMELAELQQRAVRSIDASVLQRLGAFPEGGTTLFALRSLAAFYAASNEFDLSGQVRSPRPSLLAWSGMTLRVDRHALQLAKVLSVRQRNDRLFSFSLLVPRHWSITEMADAEGNRLAYDAFALPDGSTRVVVKTSKVVAPNQPYTVTISAVGQVPGWLEQWDRRELSVPVINVENALEHRGAIAILTDPSLDVRPQVIEQLSPLDRREREEFGILTEAPLAFRFDAAKYRAVLEVEHRRPELVGRCFSFFQVSTGRLAAQQELLYTVRQATTRHLSFALPRSTPAELTIRGRPPITVREFSARETDEERIWDVTLAEDIPLSETDATGVAHLVVEWQMLLPEKMERFALPLVRFEGVTIQSGYFVVAGDLERELTVETTARPAELDELSDTETQPGGRLAGVFAYQGLAPETHLRIRQYEPFALPAAVVQRLELNSLLSAAGTVQTLAKFQLRTKLSTLELRLPEDARELWGVTIDQQPMTPYRKGQSVLLSVPAVSGSDPPRVIAVVYQSKIPPLRQGQFVLGVPTLWMPADSTSNGPQSEARLIPGTEVEWNLVSPSGFVVTRVDGGFTWRARVRWPELGIAVPAAVSPVAAPAQLESHDATFSTETMQVPMPAAAAPVGEAPMGQEALPALPPAGQTAHQTVARDERAPSRSLLSAVSDQPVQPGASEFEAIPAAGKRDRLQGVRSLVIDIEAAVRAAPKERLVHLSGVGTAPVARITTWNERYGNVAAGVLGTLLVVASLLVSRRQRWQLMVWAIALALIIPPLVGRSFELHRAVVTIIAVSIAVALCDMVVVCLKRILRIFADILDFIGARSFFRARLEARVFWPLLVSVVTIGQLLPRPICAQDRAWLDQFERLLRPPMKLPSDAVIIPYDGSELPDLARANRILVPYATYVKLWNRAYPDRPLELNPVPTDVALGPAIFQVDVQDGPVVQVDADLEFRVLVDKPASVALPFAGGVLASGSAMSGNATWELAGTASSDKPPQNSSHILIHLPGAGRHRIGLRIALPVQREGGWRVVSAMLPTPLVSGMVARVYQAPSEVRIDGVADRSVWEITTSGQAIETALMPGSMFRLQWRPKTETSVVDAALTTTSHAVFDLLEDGVRLAWQSRLEFRQGRRNHFTFLVPNGYLVERIAGENVRTWTQEVLADQVRLHVELLRTATENEEILFYLSKRWLLDETEPETFTVPAIRVEGASLEQGTLWIRRSVLLDAQLLETVGVTRTDVDAVAAEALVQRTGNEERVVAVQAFQGFQFSRLPFHVQGRVGWRKSQYRYEQLGILRVSERQLKWQTRLRVEHQGTPLYLLQVRLPPEWDIEQVSEAEWVVTSQDSYRLLTVYFGSGRSRQVDLEIVARALPRDANDPVVVPRIELLDAAGGESHWLVEVDPVFRLQVQELRGGEIVPLQFLYQQMGSRPSDPSRSQLALRFSVPDYAAALSVERRPAVVHCMTLSNVSFTPQAIEETVLLEWQVLEAGIGQVQFRLPARFAQCRLQAPALRNRSLQAVEGPNGDAQVEFTVAFQDDLMGTIRVVAKLDNPLSPEPHAVPIPHVLTGQVARQYVTVQNTGRDELVVVEQTGVDSLAWGQTPWRELAALDVTYGFLVQPQAQMPRVVLRAESRSVVQTAAARIGYGETILVVDASGDYRARHEWRVENGTEQFLKVELPARAQLWSVEVARQPAKPSATEGSKPTGQVWIPLIKTEEGEADYPVVIVYAGRLVLPPNGGTLTFPLPRTVNIHTEVHQVTLYLPESHYWVDFRGAAPLQSADEYSFAYASYVQDQVARLTDALYTKSYKKKMRVWKSLQKIEQELLAEEDAVKKQAVHGQGALSSVQQAQQQLVQQLEPEGETSSLQVENRRVIEQLYFEQQGFRAKNTAAVDELKLATGQARSPQAMDKGATINERWLAANQLDAAATATTGVSPVQQSLTQTQPEEQVVRELNVALQQKLDRKPTVAQADAAPTDRLKAILSRQGGEGRLAGAPDPSGREAMEERVEDLTPGAEPAAPTALPTRAGTASLLLDIPRHGRVFYLRGERGRVEITARAVRREVSQASIRVSTGLLLLVLGLWLSRRRKTPRRHR